MQLEVRTHAHPSSLKEAVFTHVLASEAENCLFIGLLLQLEKQAGAPQDGTLLLSLHDGSKVVGAALRTPGRHLIMTRMPNPMVGLLAARVHQLLPKLPGAIGPREVVERYAEVWSARARAKARIFMEMRVFSLTKVAYNPKASGHLRVAEKKDVDVLARFIREFSDEIMEGDGSDQRAHAEAGIAEERYHFWEDDGRIVGMAALAGATPNGIRVNAVYTPKEFRQRGYATTCVAELSHKALTAGRSFCFLFTDLANPTSNSIYSKIGYEAVCDFRHVDFSYA